MFLEIQTTNSILHNEQNTGHHSQVKEDNIKNKLIHSSSNPQSQIVQQFRSVSSSYARIIRQSGFNHLVLAQLQSGKIDEGFPWSFVSREKLQ